MNMSLFLIISHEPLTRFTYCCEAIHGHTFIIFLDFLAFSFFYDQKLTEKVAGAQP